MTVTNTTAMEEIDGGDDRRRTSKISLEFLLMEKVNTELVLRNRYIMEQNERLKKAAQLLQQEKQSLLSQLQAQVISDDNASTNPNRQQLAAAAEDGNKVAAESSSPKECK